MIILTAPMFGLKHISGLLVIAIVVGILLYFTKPTSYSNQKRIIRILAILFIILEILKIGFLIIKDGSYPLNHLPFHLCSIPLYLFPILSFTKENSKLEQIVKPAAYGVVMVAGLTALLVPVNIIGSNETWFPLVGNYLPIISFIFHGLMIFAGLYLIKSGYYKLKLSDIYKSYLVASVLMFLALIFNALLDKDYMLLNYGNGSPLQFLVEVNQALYTISMIVLGLVIIFIVFCITNLFTKKKVA